MKKVISALFLVLLFSNVCCFANSKTSTEEFTSRVKLVTSYDAILWFGLDMPDEFDPRCLNNEEKEEALANGLLVCEEKAKQGNSLYQSLLAEYYYTSIKNPNIKKGLYWAKKAAEQGMTYGGMSLLKDAYLTGTGVVKDQEEGLKWAILAAAKGDKYLKEKLDEFVKASWTNEFLKESLDEGQRRAKKWMSEHEDAFFSPD